MAVARSKAEGLSTVRRLVAQYNANRAHFRSRNFDETSTRTSFIDKFFEALGWDVTAPGPSREVVFHARHTMNATVAGEDEWDADLTQEELDARASRTDIPDYGFSIGGDLRFFVEAKRPHVGIRGRDAAFQVKSYAWNEGLPFSVLTDFEHLRVFQTTQRPDHSKPNAGLLAGYDLTCDNYVAEWDQIWALLSREQVAAGHAADAARKARPRGATPVDEAFLRDMEGWREELGNDLLVRHPDLEMRELEEATQRILDRLVFVRVVEDRNVEPNIVLRRYARLTDSYRHLAGEFRRLDAFYNGQLFDEHYSERLEISDQVIQTIIANLYAVDGSPYRFDTFSADFLGKVYERFLGKQFDRTDSGRLRLVDKPEVRHAGGVYYTPRWVVDHMVASALAPLVDRKTPRQVQKIRVVDPACGSGTFLLGVLDFLIHWHERYYDANRSKDPKNHYRDRLGQRRLTSDFKGEILVNNIFGVDVDPRAVEVAQMSLYLRILEEETAATMNAQARLFEGARLPSLAQNIRAGNSLIEPSHVPRTLLADLDLRRRINPFNWHDHATGFGAVFADRGGFDVVIGNPPYTRVQEMRNSRPEETKIIEQRYAAATAGFDIASIFAERGLALLAPAEKKARGGTLTFITSRTFTETDAGEAIRSLLRSGNHITDIVDFRSGRVFDEAGAYTVILTATARPNRKWRLTRVAEPTSREALTEALRDPLLSTEIPAHSLGPGPWSLSLPAEDALLTRLTHSNPSLADATGGVIFQGVITGHDGVFRAVDLGPDKTDPSKRLVRPASTDPASAPLSFERVMLRPIYAGKGDFQPFHTAKSREWLIMPYAPPARGKPFVLLPWSRIKKEAPGVANWLLKNETALRARSGAWSDANWYSYSRRQNLERFAESKVMVPSMLDRLCATYDTKGHYFVNVSTGGYGLGHDRQSGADPEYVAALLNSTLLSWILKRYSRAWRGGWFEARKGNLERLPVVVPPVKRQCEIIDEYRQVRQAVADAVRNPADAQATRLAQTATATFDHMVFRLYGVTAAEITLVQRA